jgi:hypothetical protein
MRHGIYKKFLKNYFKQKIENPKRNQLPSNEPLLNTYRKIYLYFIIFLKFIKKTICTDILIAFINYHGDNQD